MLKKILLGLIAVLAVIQFFPPNRTNPPEDQSRTLYANAQVPPDVKNVLERSCHDCHSNRTAWPWYSRVAPISWLLANDVHEGRRELNVSNWAAYEPKRADRKLNELCEQVERGDMPIPIYSFVHRDARLSDAEKKLLCGWTKDERQRVQARAGFTPSPARR